MGGRAGLACATDAAYLMSFRYIFIKVQALKFHHISKEHRPIVLTPSRAALATLLLLIALIAQPMTGVPLLESLRVLDLSQNHITEAGCAALTAALRSGVLPALGQVDMREDDYNEFSPAHLEIFEVHEDQRVGRSIVVKP